MEKQIYEPPELPANQSSPGSGINPRQSPDRAERRAVRRSMVQLFDYQKLHQGAKHGHGWFMFDAFVFTVDPPL